MTDQDSQNQDSQNQHRPKKVLSGMRPTGKLHLGHYHGALKNWVRLQSEYECFYFVVDWHALTTDYGDTELFGNNVVDMVIDWLATGIDPKSASICLQSAVPEHAELHLLLSMTTPLSWLERVPSYKEQQTRLEGKSLDTYGFLGYPLLQAADILIYGAEFVPVGGDQAAHVELTREVARRFNHLYDTSVLVEPKALHTEVTKLPGIDGQKMSKSYNNSIALREAPESVEKKIRTMPTDPARVRRTDPGDPDKCPVWQFHEVYSDEKTRKWVREGCTSAGIGCVDCKKPVIEAVLGELEPIRKAARPFEDNPDEVRAIIVEGSERARESAGATMERVRSAMGLDRW
ncbi:MAG: tryptophan--tRNA ligase [Gammaproteobacteria bacterium]|nr:tryptophan--tRNA ligase [Gammaproteobacteria bacterium]MXX07376.1 tryptophan--tRNA ligase [Gammaproteobacteria bacterium]MYA66838.1 tryptophan--tRNA ligase [Gammaproteobacteria bacterium]MYE28855.1 tryptophan--tRNA ligase [Gammaproteobacteria bacterium]MYH45483.1 tryptophan--tRNA ligase [Gammaproteobacteria bacterium]